MMMFKLVIGVEIVLTAGKNMNEHEEKARKELELYTFATTRGKI